MVKKYEFRELCSKDIFPMLKIINKIGFREFQNCLESESVKNAIQGMKKDNSDALKSVGMKVILEISSIIIENLPACEEDIYTMFENTSNLNKKEIQALAMSEFAEMIVDFVKKPEFMDFFKVVSRLFKPEN